MKSFTIIGIVLAVAGVGLYASTGMVLSNALNRKSIQEDASRRSEIACREQLVRLGRVTPQQNNVIELAISEIKGDPRAALADVTSALAMCPGRELVEACLGTGCGTAPSTPTSTVQLVAKFAPVPTNRVR